LRSARVKAYRTTQEPTLRTATRLGAAAYGSDVSDAPTIAVPATDTATLGTTRSPDDAVWGLALDVGDRVYVEAIVATGSTGSVSLFLWKPGTTSVLHPPASGDLAAEATYEYAPGYPAPLRMAYEVPLGGAGTYFIDVSTLQGTANVDLFVKHGPPAFTVSKPATLTTVNWGQTFTVSGTIEPVSDPAHVGTTVEVWAWWFGLDDTGVDRMKRLGSATVNPDGTFRLTGLKSNIVTMPWNSRLRLEWLGDDNEGWIDQTRVVYVRANMSIRASKSRIVRGTRILLSGRLDPATARRAGKTIPRVVIQGRVGSRAWRNLRFFNITATGMYRYYYAPSVKGRWQFRTRYMPATYFNENTQTNYTRYVWGLSPRVATVFVR